MPSPRERVYTVVGMTCAHCVAAVTEEVERLRSVDGVSVDLASGRLAVRGDGVEDSQVRAAVEDAGYEVVGAAA